MKTPTDDALEAEHSSSAIAARLDNDASHGDLGDMVLGSVDGAVTTFAIVSGIAGTGLDQGVMVAFILGLANVIADGFSMGSGSYLKARSDLQNREYYRRMEEMHIARVPEYEKEEIRQIYIRKGFSGELLEQIVDTISKNKKLWVNTMLTEEWGLQLSSIAPMRSALLTFAAFIAAGVAPLLPLLLGLFTDIRSSEIFLYSALLTSIVFLATGTLRGIILNLPVMRSALETFFVGGMAALLAYFVGDILGGFLL